MENKYYTPSIEEVSPGFEYEIKVSRYSDEWGMIKIPFSLNGCITNLDRWFNNIETIRVKHLDCDDIQSLGWVKTSGKEYFRYIYNQKDPGDFSKYQIILEPCSIGFYLIFLLREDGGIRSDQFFGKIKNKHELNKLMQQLGINE